MGLLGPVKYGKTDRTEEGFERGGVSGVKKTPKELRKADRERGKELL